MSELTTADLAGGTTPRDRMNRDDRMARESDTATRTPDPKLDTRDADMRTTEHHPGDAGFDARRESMAPTPPSGATATPASAPRRAPLANPAATDGATSDNSAAPLFPSGEAQGFRTRWVEVQTGFVDEPRHAVEQADSLVAEMMKRLATVFADERGKLEEQWSRGDDIGTEDLRQALRRYRSFFDRLLSV